MPSILHLITLLSLVSLSLSWSPSTPLRSRPFLRPKTTTSPLHPPSLLFSDGGGGDGGGSRERESSTGSKVLVKDREETASVTKKKEKLTNESMWRVLLHNDEIHTFDYVTHSIVKTIKQLTRKKAHEITVQTHSAGLATCIVVWKEEAEKYCLGLQRQGLTASISPDSGFKKGGGKGGEDGGGDGGPPSE